MQRAMSLVALFFHTCFKEEHGYYLRECVES